MRNRKVPTLSDADKAYVRSLVCHEDAQVIVFDKPSGLPVQTRGNRGRNLDHLIWAFARSNGKRPRLVHRIDAGTSGLVVAAKTQPLAAFLSEQFARRTAEKTYLAVVGGTLPSHDQGVIAAPLVQVGNSQRRSIVAKPGQPGAQASETAWQILACSAEAALIQARPKTGRMHQIRAHLLELGCPILGDPIYGDRDDTRAPRLMLHAAGLRLPLPDGGSLDLSAPPPADMQAVSRALGLGV